MSAAPYVRPGRWTNHGFEAGAGFSITAWGIENFIANHSGDRGRCSDASTLECVRQIRATPSCRRLIELSVSPEQMTEIDAALRLEEMKG